ncbi:MAG: alpha/beta hydrolase fold domain protein [Moraxellaceae bacterium]|jgi:acetyl esterase/lipase|nr:alpha/beta hydrolase fold domain protein [Moraxellaceae bacterium]
MPSLIAHSMKLFSRMYIRHNPKDPASLVRHLRRSMNHSPMPVLLPPGVRTEAWQDGGVRGDRLLVAAPEQVILYLHGGGYVCGKTRTYFNMCSRLARELNAEVLLPAYRLAPEHPFPAAIEDAVASYEWLLKQGWRGDQITIAGDSAGGGLSLGTLLALRDKGRPLPRCAVLISPYADLHVTSASIRGNDATDFMLGANMLEVGRNVYAQTPLDAAHPYASPALGDYTGLPPLFITVCDHECLRDDAYAVEARALAAGVPVTLLSRPDLMHVWPIFAPLLPEAREDLVRMANFIRGAGRRKHAATPVGTSMAVASAAPAPQADSAAARPSRPPAKSGGKSKAPANLAPAKPAAPKAPAKPPVKAPAATIPAKAPSKPATKAPGKAPAKPAMKTPATATPKPRSLTRPPAAKAAPEQPAPAGKKGKVGSGGSKKKSG